jgi:hypothetical protein
MVHVVMYWYYFQSARGIRIWWKRYITILQILQFVIDLGELLFKPLFDLLLLINVGFVYFASYTYFTSTYWPWMPNSGHCAGEEFAAIAGCVILSSYLVLFISFYIVTYQKSGKGGRPRRNTATKATIDMARAEIPSLATTTGRSGPVTRSRKA